MLSARSLFWSLLAARVLLGLHRTSAAAMKSIREGLRDRDALVRGDAARAITYRKLCDSECLKLLVDLLADQDRSVRFEAATAMGIMGKSARSGISPLQKALDHETDPEVRNAVDRALKQIQYPAQERQKEF